MFTNRPATWIAAAVAAAVALAALLLAQPATLTPLTMVLIVAGLPALYRFHEFGPASVSRRYGWAPEARTRADIQRLTSPDTARPAPVVAATPSRATTRKPERDLVDEWGVQSFPASDPPPTW